MKKITLSNIDEEVLYEKSDNGLDIYMLPNKLVKSFYMTLNVKYGSLITEFKEKNKKEYISIPHGTAHFLEHMKFYQPNGISAHEYFQKLGSSINAATSYRITFYEVYATTNFKKNLDYLLEYVYTPFFTNKDIKTEKGVIKEEIKMGLDNPYSMLYQQTNELLYLKDNMKYSIAGTVQDINKINSSMLKKVYNHFYKPDNMYLVITGNFNPLEAVAIVNQKMKKLKFSKIKEVEIKTLKEPDEVKEKEKILNMDITTPKFKLTYKIPYKKFKDLNLHDIELVTYLNIILKNNFDTTSTFYQKLNEEKVLSSTIYFNSSVRKEHDYIIISLEAETKYPELIKEKIIKNLSEFKITEEFLNRCKKILLSNLILYTDSIQTMNSMIQNNILFYGKVIQNEYEMINELNLDTINKIIKLLNFKTSIYVEINPINKN